MNDRLQRREGRQIIKWILLSVVVLSHIVIASQIEGDSGSPDYQNGEHKHAVDPSSEERRGEPPPANTAPDPTDDKGSGDDVVVINQDQGDDGKYAKAITDNGANQNTSSTSHSENNFSQAFNLKHLIYFENSSQNNGIPSIPSPSHIYNIMEKSENMKLESKITSKLETILLNGTTKEEMSPVSAAKTTEASSIAAAHLKQKADRGESQEGVAATLDPVPTDGEEAGNDTQLYEDVNDLKDEVVDSMEPTPLSDSDFVTEDPSQTEVEVAGDMVQPQVNATAEEHPIPVFSEWAKQMEKAEKQQEQDVANASSNKNKTTDRSRISSPKLRAKNYASPDCGAKIIASNQESDNTGHVLSSSKDEYLISICTSRIWFVVELCEPIQAEKVELANFELFSSSPKEFSVSVSNRYPTRDWSNVGQFEAKDERTIQNFDLHPQLFGKFVRVDIHSHYNKEHFCPVSLFRVYGTSEFEAFETENLQAPLEDYDDDDEAEGKKDAAKQDSNLFKSASDAVFSIVKKAASVLTKGEDKNLHGGINETVKQRSHGDECISLAYVVACEKCPEQMQSEVADILSCKRSVLDSLMRWSLVQEIIHKTELCSEVIGMSFMGSNERSLLVNRRDLKRDFVAKLFPESYLIAICNMAGIDEKRMRNVNTSVESNGGTMEDIVVNNLTLDEPGLMEKLPTQIEQPLKETQPLICDNQGIVDSLKVIPREVEKVVEERRDPVEVTTEENLVEASLEPPKAENMEIPTQVDRPPEAEEGKAAKEEEVTKEMPTGDLWKGGDNGLEASQDPTNMNPMPKGHGESVFIRLSNRIKALERNMSLSSQYLEELSRRYKKQVEELQQSFAKTILSFEETSKQTVEEKQHLVDENARLRRDIEEVLANFFAWKSILFYLCIFVCIQIVLFVLLLLLYIKNRLRERRREKRREEEDRLRHLEDRRISVSDGKSRRNSTEGISVSSRSTTSLSEGKKRPSEEALQIVGTYSELLIETPPKDVEATSSNKKKNKSGRNRKTSLPNQVYVTEKKKAESGGTNSSNKLIHSNSVNGYSTASAGADIHTEEDLSSAPIDPILLEENDEFYLPGSDLSYIEFVPEDPETSQTKSSNRRLSSPAFLRTALSKSARASKKASKKREQPSNEEDGQSNTSTSSWDWYKLRRSSSSSQAAKSEQLRSLNGSVLNNGSVSLSSQDSVNPQGSTTTTADGDEQSPKKTTKFRKIFKKVF